MFNLTVASFVWQFFAKVGITAKESIMGSGKKYEYNHGDFEI